jgi:hypothetical protein
MGERAGRLRAPRLLAFRCRLVPCFSGWQGAIRSAERGMKLCKDCKHCVPPSIYSLALCGHEKAERSPYDGFLVEVVHFARTQNGICGPDAKLFEQREPDPQINPGAVVPIEPAPDLRIGFWARIFEYLRG